MSKKKIVMMVLFFLLVFVVSFIWIFLSKPPVGKNQEMITIGEKQITVEVVRTNDQIQKGLSGRKEIGADGMLFVLPARYIPKFWMKEMLFPLDFIWIDGGRVVDITAHVPVPKNDTRLSDLPTYSPKVPVTMVLEVASGFVSKHDIKIGDSVK